VLKKVELFLRTRSHVLVLVGALIVFLTFVIKEGLREHWKGTADAIETAEYFYPLLAQSAEIKTELRKVEDQQFKSAHPQSSDMLVHFSLFRIDEEFLTSQEETLDDLEMSAANRRILIDVLPGGDSLRKEADLVDSQLAKLRTTLSVVDQKMAKVNYNETLAERRHPLDKDRRAEEFDKSEPPIGAEVKESYDALVSTGLASSALSKNVLEHARAIRARNAHYSAYAWWISAFLFALGWGLGLVGKLYGVPEASSGE
jgi:hypothetical protein